MGTDRGLNRIRNGQIEQTFTTRQGLPSNTILSLFRDHAGTLWAGTSAGLAELENATFEQVPAQADADLRTATSAPVLAIGEDRTGRLFFATERGVFSYSGGKVTELMQDGAPLRSVDTFFLDRDGLLWMGALGGPLRMLNGDKLASFLTRDGLFDNEIYGIVQDNNDRLWMACSKGIFCGVPGRSAGDLPPGN